MTKSTRVWFSSTFIIFYTYLEDDELPGCPDMSPRPQPVNLPPEDAEEEEKEEDGVHHQGGLDDPHGDSGDILKGGGR